MVTTDSSKPSAPTTNIVTPSASYMSTPGSQYQTSVNPSVRAVRNNSPVKISPQGGGSASGPSSNSSPSATKPKEGSTSAGVVKPPTQNNLTTPTNPNAVPIGSAIGGGTLYSDKSVRAVNPSDSLILEEVKSTAVSNAQERMKANLIGSGEGYSAEKQATLEAAPFSDVSRVKSALSKIEAGDTSGNTLLELQEIGGIQFKDVGQAKTFSNVARGASTVVNPNSEGVNLIPISTPIPNEFRTRLDRQQTERNADEIVGKNTAAGLILTSAQSTPEGVALSFRERTPTEKLSDLGVYYADPNKIIAIPYNAKGNESAASIIGGSIDYQFELIRTAAFSSADATYSSRNAALDKELLNATGSKKLMLMNQKVSSNTIYSFDLFRVGVQSATGYVLKEGVKSALLLEPAGASVAISTKYFIKNVLGEPVVPTPIESQIMFKEKQDYVLGTFAAPLQFEVAPKLIVGAIGAGSQFLGETFKVSNPYIFQRGAEIAGGWLIALTGATAGIYKTEQGDYKFSPQAALGGVLGAASMVYVATEVYPKVGSFVFQNAPILKLINNPYIREEIVSPQKFDQYAQAGKLAGVGSAAEQKAAGSENIMSRVAALKSEKATLQQTLLYQEKNIINLGDPLTVKIPEGSVDVNPYSTGSEFPGFRGYSEWRSGYSTTKARLGDIDAKIASMTKPMVDKNAVEAARSARINDMFKGGVSSGGGAGSSVVSGQLLGRQVFLSVRPLGLPTFGFKTSSVASTSTTVSAPSVVTMPSTRSTTSTRTFTSSVSFSRSSLANIQKSIQVAELREATLPSFSQALSSSQSQALSQSLSQAQTQALTQSQAKVQAKALSQAEVLSQANMQANVLAQVNVNTFTSTLLLTRQRLNQNLVPTLPPMGSIGGGKGKRKNLKGDLIDTLTVEFKVGGRKKGKFRGL